MNTHPTAGQITEFTRHYIAAGFELAEEEVNELYPSDLAEADRAHIEKDCAEFIYKAVAAGLLSKESDMEQAGTDYWLTRNGHGTGFWSREEIYGEHEAAALSELARQAGPSDFELGDDGHVHHYPPVSYLNSLVK